MATRHPRALIEHLRRAASAGDPAASDARLLCRYVTCRDDAAFEGLVRAHGPMVLGVCRRLLRDPHDAEDAFQATFLVLVKKAASVSPPERLSGWLYGVARQVAIRARAAAARRQGRETLVDRVPDTAAPAATRDRDEALDEELARLPARYRDAVVLCHLEGLSHQAAAGRLGWPVGTLASRVSRGRRLLAHRLAQRGVGPPESAAPCWVPGTLVSSTVRAGSLFGSGHAAGAVAADVVALTEGVLRAMAMNTLSKIGIVLLAACALALGGGSWAMRPVHADDPAPPFAAGKPAAAAKEPQHKLDVQADGKTVTVHAVFGDEELYAKAERVRYDAIKQLLVLERNVQVQRLQGKRREHVTCDTMVYDAKSGRVEIRGAVRVDTGLGVRIYVPALEPTPVSLDTGFPVGRDPREVFSFYLGFMD